MNFSPRDDQAHKTKKYGNKSEPPVSYAIIERKIMEHGKLSCDAISIGKRACNLTHLKIIGSNAVDKY